MENEPQINKFLINVNRNWYVNVIWYDLFIFCSFVITKLLFWGKISQNQAQFGPKIQFFNGNFAINHLFLNRFA